MTVEQWLGVDNKLGIDIWNKKYRYENESFDEWLDRVSGGDEELRQLILERKFLFGGRTLANRGTNKQGSFSNCYSRGFVEDNVPDIMQANTDIALTFKAQGGQGLSLSKLRPKGCGVCDGQYESDGIIPFMEMFNQTTIGISQGGSRKGALLMSLDIWHKEAEDFIKIKSEKGKIEKANLSLEIDDDFMECVSKYYKDGTIVNKHIEKTYNGNKVSYNVTPINLYKLMMEKAYDWAEPGCIYTNRFRNYNLMEFHPEYEIETCNPCFSGDMRLLTTDGYKTFEELEGKTVQIYNADGNVSESRIWCSGEKDTVKVILANGDEIICTPDHRFMTNDNKECLARNLAGKYIVPLHKINNIHHDKKFIKLGFLQGDAELATLDYEYPTNYIVVNIGEKDTDIRELFNDEEFEIPNSIKGHRTIHLYNYNDVIHENGFSLKPLPNREFPLAYDDWDYHQKASFLCGCYSANGSIITSANRVSYKTTCKAFADKLADTLEKDFGIKAYITVNKEKETKFENGIYLCKESYDVNISAFSSRIIFASEIGFYQYYKKETLSDNLKLKGAKVYRVEPYKKMRVYDFTEPMIHWGIVNGYVVHNCGEQPLAKNSACNLGSINLSEFVINPFTKDAFFDELGFEKAVGVAVEALDNVLDENVNNHALAEQQEMAMNYRNVGLGIMGMHDFLIKLGITYGDEESKKLIDQIMDVMFKTAVIKSSELAKEKGSFPKYDNCVLNSEIIKRHFTDEELEETGIKLYGLRNCSLLSIAPAGSIGTMLNISTGCEPLFQIFYKRKTESLNGEDTYYDVYSGVAQEYINSFGNKEFPTYFNTSSDINWHDRIDIQSVLQNHVDTAISSTVNLPNNISQEEIEQLYLYAWEKGLKGVTIYRDGCKRAGILSTHNEDKAEVKVTEKKELGRGYIYSVDDDLISYKRTIKNGCGKFYLHLDFDEETGEPFETWIDLGGHGGCERNLQLISRLMSLCLRGGIPLSEIIEQTKSIRPCLAYTNRTKSHGDTSPGTSCPSAIGIALKELQDKIHERCFADDDFEVAEIQDNIKKLPVKQVTSTKPLCPDCGEELIFEGGCNLCRSCGWSKCS